MSSSSSDRFGRPAHPAQDQRQIGLGRRPAGRKLDRPAKQVLRIAPPPDARRQLGQHADRRGIERVFLEVRLQQALGDVEPVLVQRHRRLDQARVQMVGSGRHVATSQPSGRSSRQAVSRRYAPPA